LFFYIVFITDGTSSKLGKRRKGDEDDNDDRNNNNESCSKSRQESADSRGGKLSQKKKRNKSSNISLGLQLNKANTKIEALEKLIDELKEEGEALEKQIDELKEDAETQLENYQHLEYWTSTGLQATPVVLLRGNEMKLKIYCKRVGELYLGKSTWKSLLQSDIR
jgi:signal recognition particle GTPase